MVKAPGDEKQSPKNSLTSTNVNKSIVTLKRQENSGVRKNQIVTV